MAFVTLPEDITKDKRSSANWGQYPLTPHGEMLDALMRSRISAYPHNAVAIQYFETVGRYGDFFKVRKQYVEGVLTTFIDARCVGLGIAMIIINVTLFLLAVYITPRRVSDGGFSISSTSLSRTANLRSRRSMSRPSLIACGTYLLCVQNYQNQSRQTKIF
jgi:hypothetical protein